jgi:hypothetical protein
MIIGLSGYARSGKDEVAKILVEDYGYKRIAFADKIRELLIETNPQVRDGFRVESVVGAYGWEQAKVLFPEVRKLLQDLGVGARKTFGDSFWIGQVIDQFGHSWWGYDTNVVVTDVRFINEANAIKGKGGKIWRIKRPGVEPVNNHVSERDMDGYNVDKILKNEGTLEDLRTLVHNRMEFTLNAN